MKKLFFPVIIAIAFTMVSCTTHRHTHTSSNGLPPGQAKKITGSQSAKQYAPGQQKKH